MSIKDHTWLNKPAAEMCKFFKNIWPFNGHRALNGQNILLNPLTANPQNGQTHSNNSTATADELFECVKPFSGVGV